MRTLIALAFLALPSMASAQLGVAFHQSTLPFISLNYEIKNRVRPEVRIGTDRFLSTGTLEGVVLLDLLQKDDYEVYAGAGVQFRGFDGIVLPAGLNVYPLSSKQFGFHIEMAALFSGPTVLRGSWGIRYRFGKDTSQ